MARAKRTDRTDARRRHRAEQAALAATDPETEVIDATSPGKRGTTAQAAPAPQQRPSITAAFRGAIRPLDLPGDLRNIKDVVLNLGFLGATAGTVAIAVVFVIAYSGSMSAIPVGTATVDQMTAILVANDLPYQLVNAVLLQPPPIFGALIIGFMAKRASWLGGLIYGTTTVALVLFVLQTPSGRLLTTDGKQTNVDIIAGYAALSPIGTALFASSAAWYRRFLALANPNRGQRQPARPARGRGDMKTSRR